VAFYFALFMVVPDAILSLIPVNEEMTGWDFWRIAIYLSVSMELL
jgi:hypothetical protein